MWGFGEEDIFLLAIAIFFLKHTLNFYFFKATIVRDLPREAHQESVVVKEVTLTFGKWLGPDFGLLNRQDTMRTNAAENADPTSGK